MLHVLVGITDEARTSLTSLMADSPVVASQAEALLTRIADHAGQA